MSAPATSTATSSVATTRRTILPTEANFTWDDLQRIKGNLTLADDSSWVPAKLRNNLIGTIKYVLDPKNAIDGIPLSTGVSLRDLYHAHIVNPKTTAPQRKTMNDTVLKDPVTTSTVDQKEKVMLGGPTPGILPESIRKARQKFMSKYDTALARAYPGEFPFLGASPAERDAIRKLNATLQEDFRSLIELIVDRLPHARVIYHTYESIDLRQGVMESDDPRRHILMPFNDSTPIIGARLLDESGKPSGEYPDVMQFTFLVSPRGEVFVRCHREASLLGLEFTEPE